MRTLVFVHGRGQQGASRALRQRWAAGLNKGLTAAGRDAMDSAAIDAIRFPFYGDVLWAAVVQGRAAVPDVAALRAVQQVDPWAPDEVNRREVAVLQPWLPSSAADLSVPGGGVAVPSSVLLRLPGVGGQPFRGRRGRDPRLVCATLPPTWSCPAAGRGPRGWFGRRCSPTRLGAGRPQPRRGRLRGAPDRGRGPRPGRPVRCCRGAPGAGRGHRRDAAQGLSQADLAMGQRLRPQGLGWRSAHRCPEEVAARAASPSPTPAPMTLHRALPRPSSSRHGHRRRLGPRTDPWARRPADAPNPRTPPTTPPTPTAAP